MGLETLSFEAAILRRGKRRLIRVKGRMNGAMYGKGIGQTAENIGNETWLDLPA